LRRGARFVSRDIRLVTFAAGTVFGELAILDKGARSASVVADEELVCHVLSDRDFEALSTECHSAAIKAKARARIERPPAQRQSGDPAVGGLERGSSLVAWLMSAISPSADTRRDSSSGANRPEADIGT
jgi:hypothetical protein